MGSGAGLGRRRPVPAGRRLRSELGGEVEIEIAQMTKNVHSCFILKILTSVFQDP